MKGTFIIQDFNNLSDSMQKLYQRSTMGMHVFKNSQHVLIAFEHSIIFLDVMQKFAFNEISEMEIKIQKMVQDIKVSPNEKLLAISLAPINHQNSEDKPKIEIYEINFKDLSYKLVISIINVHPTNSHMDFSIDNYYLLYKDTDESDAIWDLASDKAIDNLHDEFDIEWMSRGLKISRNTTVKQ
jgi:hypothetical protein